jgi:hypothetical protein
MELGLLFLVATKPRTLYRELGTTVTTFTVLATSLVLTLSME